MSNILAPPNWNAAPNESNHKCDHNCTLSCESCGLSICADSDEPNTFHFDEGLVPFCPECYKALQAEIESENKRL